MRNISAEFAEALGVSHRRTTRITCTVPGGDPIEIGPSALLADGVTHGPGWSACTVSCSNSSGARYSANLTITPAPGQDTYAIVSTPGAIFDIDHGIDFGAGHVELVDCGVYEATQGGVNILDGDITLSLVDKWARLERCRFLTPYAPTGGTRASRITEAVTAAVPGTSTSVLASGGTLTAGGVWDQSRTQFVTDLAKDGGLDAYFDASSVFIVRAEPILTPTAPDWTFSSSSNIETATRERPFDRLYNTVVVIPADETQTWARQTVTLSDPTHPRHPDKIGVVPFFWSSPTLMTASAAKAAGETILQRVLGTTETVNLGGLGNPALEVGDTVSIVHPATETDPGFAAFHLIDSLSMDLANGRQTVATRSTSVAQLESA